MCTRRAPGATCSRTQPGKSRRGKTCWVEQPGAQIGAEATTSHGRRSCLVLAQRLSWPWGATEQEAPPTPPEPGLGCMPVCVCGGSCVCGSWSCSCLLPGWDCGPLHLMEKPSNNLVTEHRAEQLAFKLRSQCRVLSVSSKSQCLPEPIFVRG